MDLPAWSEPFAAGLPRVRPLGAPITRQWAWGGAEGRGVKVAVIDSGVDGDHPRVGGIDGGVTLSYDGEGPEASASRRVRMRTCSATGPRAPRSSAGWPPTARSTAYGCRGAG